LIPRVHQADCLENAADRTQALAEFGDEILRRNQLIFFSGVANQAFPINRGIGGRWFDEMGWAPEILERAASLGKLGNGADSRLEITFPGQPLIRRTVGSADCVRRP
jgi:hypothetical protein